MTTFPFKFQYNRSLFPGKYIHNLVHTNVFAIRVKIADKIYSQVLSTFDGSDSGGMCNWKWKVPPASVKYHACFPRAWTVFTEPIPGLNVTIRQVSPFIPHSYSESSFPTCCFHVVVENIQHKSTDVEVSIMFCFENGYEAGGSTNSGSDEDSKDNLHGPFSVSTDTDASSSDRVVGVCMSHSKRTKVKGRMVGGIRCPLGSTQGKDAHFIDQGSFSIATNDDGDGIVSFTEMMHVDSEHKETFSIFSSNNGNDGSSSSSASSSSCSTQTVWEAFHNTGHLTNDMESVEKQAVTSKDSRRVASCICKHKIIRVNNNENDKGNGNGNNNSSTFSFALSWDHPVARFGSGMAVPRYYTRFFGDSGIKHVHIFTHTCMYNRIQT